MNRKIRLAQKFREQEAFAAGYSPLYACLFGTVASWLESSRADQDPLVQWLVEIGDRLRSLDLTLLLAAGLQKRVLTAEPETIALAQFYPSVGGSSLPDAPSFAAALRELILAEGHQLTRFMGEQKVQTNETGRGLCWLLPLYDTGWSGIHLVDLGASAGLNLVAERRAYRLLAAENTERILDLGFGRPVQFEVIVQAGMPPYYSKSLPAIVSRTGCDLEPFHLDTSDDELTLMSFIWADQLERSVRLVEGIKAFRGVQASESPIYLHRVDLPDQIETFLRSDVPSDNALPVVIYNTYMTIYLKDRGRSLNSHVDKWALEKSQPVLWLQWEPLPTTEVDASENPPEPGWCAWTADLWRDGRRYHWLLGWAHPHGTSVELLPGYEAWQRFWLK